MKPTSTSALTIEALAERHYSELRLIAHRRRLHASMNVSISFYAGSPGVTYIVEASADLKTWESEGVALNEINDQLTASIELNSPLRFLRFRVGIGTGNPTGP